MKKTDIDDKVERLLHAMDHPEEYSDQELEDMLADEETRQVYEMAVTLTPIPPPMELAPTPSSHARTKRGLVAAIIVGVLMLSGIAIAAIHFWIQTPSTSDDRNLERSTEIIEDSTPKVQRSTSSEVRTFENVELQQIMEELSVYYNVGVMFHNEEARHIRLYTKWNTAAPLQQMLERLNGFEKVNIKLSDGQLIVE